MSIAERLREEVAARQSDLVALTQDLIRIPTLNPPGALYREICDYLDRRLLSAGFETQLIRAEGAIGDSDSASALEYRGTARGRAARGLRAFQQSYRCGRSGSWLDGGSVRRRGEGWPCLWPRGL